MKKGCSYFGVRDPDHVLSDMKELRSLGFTHVLHTFSEYDLQYYPETMGKIIQDTKNLGLGVYINPWGVGRVFGGEAYTELTGKFPELAQVSNSGERVLAVCLNRPAFKQFIFQWIDVVCNTQVDTIFWDEPHFYFNAKEPESWWCRCEYCQNLFLEKFKKNMPQILSKEVKLFREACLIDFISEVTTLVKKWGKKNNVCLLPHWFNDGFESWESVTRLSTVDEISTDPYWKATDSYDDVFRTYTSYSKELLEFAQNHNKEAQMWVMNYRIPLDQENRVEAATRASYKAGIRNIFTWSFKASKNLSWLKCGNWQKVWETQIQAFNACLD